VLIEAVFMKIAVALLCLLTLDACSNKPPAPQSDPKSAAAQPSAPWDAMKQDEQRAKDVQKLVDKRAAEQDKQIEQQMQ
jgi:hypothetical protein